MPGARPITNVATPADYDVLVVGGGHAGAEAAVAAARAGARVAMVTSSLETIGQMSCNPAIGGVAKGTVVREVDALGGVMGRATDRAMIQFRMLNRGKGPAVWAPRAQCDRALYRRAVRSIVESQAGVSVVQGTVRRLIFAPGEPRVAGVETMDGRRLAAGCIVITTGTFLRGRMHVGTDSQEPGGRAGEPATTHLAEQLTEVGLTVGRFKTGTPPRIDGRTVDYAALQRQDTEIADFPYRWSAWGDPDHSVAPVGSPAGAAGGPPHVPCWITYAGEATKAIVAENIGRSAMYGGAIGARGPRYCPSIEDKLVRFPAAARHQLFLEPDGLDTDELYVNGLSTSLPALVQLEMLRSVPGLEQVEMTRSGYAIEYDYYPPTQLYASLEVRAIAGLFFAGQINGTTGYEEAAAQGLLAGLNAARATRGQAPWIPARSDAYLGVLVDDLVTQGATEPYRMFTSRAEHRLLLREDNADERLTPIGRELGLVDDARWAFFTRKQAAIAREERRLGSLRLRPADVPGEWSARVLGGEALSRDATALELLRRPGIDHAALVELLGPPVAAAGEAPDARIATQLATALEVRARYTGYIERAREELARAQRSEALALPADLDYAGLAGLSNEVRQKLAQVRPRTLGQAGRLPGVTPAAVSILLVHLKRRRLA
jgi:tRNA uridine 5-carboxymethylaminomethyl modification enzyme